MRTYEITNVLKPGTEEETKKSISDILAKHSIQINQQDDWGSKKLWHPIDGNETGTYTYTKCSAEPKVIHQVESEFRLNQNILRSLVILVDGK